MPSRGGVIRIAGVLFTLSFIAAFFMLGDAYGSFGDSDETFAEYYETDRESDLLGAALMALAAAAFCVFAVRTAEDGSATNRTLLTIALACFAILVLVSAACIATIPATRAFGSMFSDEGQATSAHWLLPQLAYLLLGAAGLSAACALLLITLGGAAPQLPGAVHWTGVLVGVLLFTSVVIMPLLLLPLWTFVASMWHGVSSEA
jgi:hypothetical protein